MKRLLSTKYTPLAFNAAMLILRLGMGLLMIPHGYDKLIHFSTYKKDFMNFLGLGGGISLGLVVFSEFFCSIFIMIGLFTRLMVIPLIIEMFVVVFKAHHGEIFGEGEHGMLFIFGFMVILLCGPGKASVDGISGK
jgi:putative oxidoreductase